MSLGTNGFKVMMGDLVRVVSSRLIAIPKGTIAPICGILSGKEEKYQLAGYENVFIAAEELELVCYTRNLEDCWH